MSDPAQLPPAPAPVARGVSLGVAPPVTRARGGDAPPEAPEGPWTVERIGADDRVLPAHDPASDAQPIAEIRMRRWTAHESTKEMDDFVQSVERTQEAIAQLHATGEPGPARDRVRASRMRELHQLAQLGLAGSAPQVSLAARLLVDQRQGILDQEAPRRKQAHMRHLGLAAAQAGLPALAVGVAANALAGADISGMTEIARGLGFLLAACAAGVWVSFAARKAQYTFEDLIQPERDYLSPGMRIAFAMILTVVIGLLFHVGGAKVELGTIQSTMVLRSPEIAVVVGFLCGFSEQVLAKSLQARAGKMLGL